MLRWNGHNAFISRSHATHFVWIKWLNYILYFRSIPSSQSYHFLISDAFCFVLFLFFFQKTNIFVLYKITTGNIHENSWSESALAIDSLAVHISGVQLWMCPSQVFSIDRTPKCSRCGAFAPLRTLLSLSHLDLITFQILQMHWMRVQNLKHQAVGALHHFQSHNHNIRICI